jgi:hypothetical protein
VLDVLRVVDRSRSGLRDRGRGKRRGKQNGHVNSPEIRLS